MLDPVTRVEMGDTQAAADFVGAKMSARMHDFHQATEAAVDRWPGRSRSLISDEEIDNVAQIRLYADVLRNYMVGNYFFHADPGVSRYALFPDSESRKSRFVNIP
jgi:hypothetical protein